MIKVPFMNLKKRKERKYRKSINSEKRVFITVLFDNFFFVCQTLISIVFLFQCAQFRMCSQNPWMSLKTKLKTVIELWAVGQPKVESFVDKWVTFNIFPVSLHTVKVCVKLNFVDFIRFSLNGILVMLVENRKMAFTMLVGSS